MIEEIKIDLRGLDLNDAEVQKITDAAHAALIQILAEQSHPKTDAVLALGPGWVGIQNG